MTNIFCEVSKYIMIILFAMYTYEAFAVFKKKNRDEESQANIFHRQNVFMFLIHLDGFLVLFDESDHNMAILLFYGAQVIFLMVVLSTYRLLYEKSSRLVVNNMCMLMAIGFIMLTRLSVTKAVRQFGIAVAGMLICLLIPLLIQKIRFIRNMTWLYAAVGILSLAIVAVAGSTSYGAKLSISFGGVAVQPSEFVKIVFVFFVAGMFYKTTTFKQVVITTVLAAIHVLILVASNDLGGALILFVAYLIMLYVATRKLLYFIAGLASGSVAAVIAYQLFSHVQTRVIAWQDPLSVIENEGYQISQSLFAIGTGGWFGSGLGQGSPDKIPVVEQDFMFSAISEEMGGIFALCMIMVCMSCFLMFLNIAMQMKDTFYKLVALGLGSVYGFQVFLTIGGVIKFIPSTGVTLPLVSYGGSSLLSTLIIFAIIQGFYIIREDEGASNEKKNAGRKPSRKTNKEPKKARKGKTHFNEDVQELG